MSNCPSSNLEQRIKNLENISVTSMALINALTQILKIHGLVDEKGLNDKVTEIYDTLALQLLEPKNRTIH